MYPETWTTRGFLQYYASVDEQMNDRAFAFVLGAGASRSSGIPTGGELVYEWLSDLQQRLDPECDNRSVDEWAASADLGIEGFDFTRAAEFYSQIFERCFGGDPEEGYARLEQAMKDAEPSFGYSVLAHILSSTRHNVVITTNFDNLVADALSIYTRTHPLVCGHESLTGFVRARMRRPVIAKIHRDLLLEPRNDTIGTSELAPEWANTLRALFRQYTPIVLGYGGNDGSLMGFLRALQPGDIRGRIIWLYREADGRPKDTICSLVGKHNGVIVPIAGFDELMIQLSWQRGYQFMHHRMQSRAEERVQRYIANVVELNRVVSLEDTGIDDDVRLALREMVRGVDNEPLAWVIRSGNTNSMAERVQILEEGLSENPGDPVIKSALVGALWKSGIYHRALPMQRELMVQTEDREDYWIYLNNLGSMLTALGDELDEATSALTRATAMAPLNPIPFGNLAVLHLRKGHPQPAEEAAAECWRLCRSKRDSSRHAIRSAFCRGLVARVHGLDDGPAIGRIKRLVEAYRPQDWPWPLELTCAVEGVRDRLNRDDLIDYERLAVELSSDGCSADLSDYPRWSEIRPIALNRSWPLSTLGIISDEA